ncbi:MAG: flippase-like domain-containing protein [Thermoflexales bacterium]|nr:flippase-like domain-containing protein [Thermoflexales bacterium]
MSLVRRWLTVRWATVSLVLIVISLLMWLVVRNWNELVTFPWRLHLGYLSLTMILHSAGLGVTFVVWHLMLKRLSGFGDWRVNFRYYYVSVLAKRVPTSVPFISGRLVMYRQAGVPASIVLNCIALEALLVGAGGVITLVTLWPFTQHVPWQIFAVFAAPTAFIMGLLLVRPSVFFELTNQVLRRLNRPTLDRFPVGQDIILWTMLYVIPWVTTGASFYFAPQALSTATGPDPLQSIIISTVSMLISLGSLLLPAGFGLKEVASTILLSSWVPLPAASVIVIAYRVIHTVDEIIFALLALVATARITTTTNST